MRRFQEKQKIKTRVYSKSMLIGLLVLSLLFAKAVANIYMKYRESTIAAKVAQAKLEQLKDREVSLKSDIDNLQSKEGVEEELRKKYNVANPGEKMIVVVEEEKAPVEEEKKGFLGSIFQAVKGWFTQH